TIGRTINFPGVAKAAGLKSFGTVQTITDINNVLPQIVKDKHTAFLEIKIKKGARKDLGRPTTSTKQNKDALKQFLNSK
ncbi:MAG: phosphonopyruvate decarboxylase, partial [Clostridiaceae bacterium]|nr:phosphonopyruvate decarboxylase [Clostridiaceae bacterium]